MSKSLLVLGGTGFIGKHVTIRALKEGYKTFVLCRNYPINDKKVEGIEYLEIDLTKPTDIEKIRNYCFNFVINLSGDINHSDMSNGGNDVIKVHLNGLIELISNLSKDGLESFLQIGSSDEYGNINAPQHENHLEKPFSPYSYAKFAASHFIKCLYRAENFPGKVLRPFLIYGPGQEQDRLIPYVIKNALNGNSFKVSSGEQLRDFLYINDAVDVIFEALTNHDINGEIINIGSGKPVRVKDVVQKIIKMIGSGKPLYGSQPIRQGIAVNLYPNIEKSRNLLKWEPKFSLDDGLKEYIQNFN